MEEADFKYFIDAANLSGVDYRNNDDDSNSDKNESIISNFFSSISTLLSKLF